MIRGITKPYGEKIDNSEPVRCQKCGKPLGYVTVLARGMTSFQQPIRNVKIVAICMECAQRKDNVLENEILLLFVFSLSLNISVFRFCYYHNISYCSWFIGRLENRSFSPSTFTAFIFR